jgi:4-hydroxybenzoate polyprenyltransferase
MSCAYLKNKPDLVVAGLFFLITSGIYLLNRVIDKEDKLNNFERWQFFNGTRARTFFWITISAISLIGPILTLLALQHYRAAVLFIGISLFGTMYSIKMIPLFYKGIRWISLKDIPLIKTIVVASTWAGSALMLATTISGISFFRIDILAIFATCFICTLNSTITADARDTQGDRQRKIYTIPVLIGSRATFILLTVINGLGVVCAALLAMIGILPLQLVIYVGVCIVWTGLCIVPQYTRLFPLSKTSLELLVDSHVMICAIGLGIFYFL